MTPETGTGAIARANRNRLLSLAGAADILFVATMPANVVYCSGYRSMGYDTDPAHRMAVVFDASRTIVVGPMFDLWGAAEAGERPYSYFGYGRFFFDHAEMSDLDGVQIEPFPDADAALEAAVRELSAGKTWIASDVDPCESRLKAALQRLEGDALLFRRARAFKSEAEIGHLVKATAITEAALTSGLAIARAGVTEADIAAEISSVMLRQGLRPGFVVVTAGPRAALADVHPSLRLLRPGDAVRIDIGGTLDGYWSDTAMSAIVGEPSRRISNLNAALLAGQAAALEAIGRPGVTTREIFEATMAAVHAGGLPDYRRHHVGHGLGLEPHEFPTIKQEDSVPLVPGMVMNVETPYYRPGWGGLMYEDTVVIREAGVERVTGLENHLVILPA